MRAPLHATRRATNIAAQVFAVAATRLELGMPATDIATSAAGVKTAIGQAVVWEGHNDNSPGSKGISIEFSSPFFFQFVSADYASLAFSQFNWDEFLATAPE